jgi:mannose-6-phosphate isomerase-like protein (cupin superfamily)
LNPRIVKANALREVFLSEGCFLFENWGISTGDETVSIAHARVETGVTTKVHHLVGIQEIYIVTKGTGKVHVGEAEPAEISEGDVVTIPAGVSQKVTNTGENDLIFYCVCTPAFTQERYVIGKPNSPV